MKIKSERDFWSGLMFIAVGVGFAIGATNYSMGPACPPNDPCAANLWARMSQLSAHPGAGYFPLGLAILLVFAIALLASSMRVLREYQRQVRLIRIIGISRNRVIRAAYPPG